MYGNDYTILAGLIGLAALITFFVMAFKLSKIARIAEMFQNAYLTGSENMINVKCDKCGKEFKASKELSVVNCPECKAINRVKQ